MPISASKPNPTITALLILTLVSTAAFFGFFYAYSVSAMRGLDFVDPVSAITAMNGINSTVQNPLFAFSFFGAPLLLAISCVATFKTGAKRSAVFTFIGLVILVAGAHAITFAVSIPMNRELLTVSDPASLSNAASVWQAYSSDWTFWNHVRTIASGLSVACLGGALLNLRTAASQN